MPWTRVKSYGLRGSSQRGDGGEREDRQVQCVCHSAVLLITEVGESAELS